MRRADAPDTVRVVDRSSRYLPKVEIGWLVYAAPASNLEQVVATTSVHVERALASMFPEFEWCRTVVVVSGRPAEDDGDPVVLLDAAEAERDAQGWDFVFVVADRIFAGTDLRHPRAVLSGLLSTAVISVPAIREARKPDKIERAMAGLALHLFGLLNNLAPGCAASVMRDPDFAMDWFDKPAGLNTEMALDEPERQQLRNSLEKVSDPRVEEMGGARPGRIAFYLRSIARNRRALPRQILRMHPWSFPVRLSRLTTASLSAILVLMMTAESWEVAANLPPGPIIILAVTAILATSAYLLRAQRLLARGSGSIREQRAVRNVGTALAVLLGMSITFLVAFGLVLGFGHWLFGDALLERWTDAAPSAVRTSMAGFTAAFSLAIGALGASFERYGHFRRVTHIDREL